MTNIWWKGKPFSVSNQRSEVLLNGLDSEEIADHADSGLHAILVVLVDVIRHFDGSACNSLKLGL